MKKYKLTLTKTRIASIKHTDAIQGGVFNLDCLNCCNKKTVKEEKKEKPINISFIQQC